jgi:hypothetical protein
VLKRRPPEFFERQEHVMKRFSMRAAGCVCAMAMMVPVRAEEAKPAAAAPPPAAPAASGPLKLGSVIVTGSVRTRTEMWDWYEGSGDNAYAFHGSIFRLSFLQSKKRWEWGAELAAPVLLGLPERAVAPGAQGAMGLGANYYTANHRNRNAAVVFPKQGYVRFKGIGGNDNQWLKLGRFEFNDATEIAPKDPALAAIKAQRISQRLIGTFGWTHVGRSFDGFHYSTPVGKNNLTWVSALPTRGVFQVDGFGPLATGFSYMSLNGNPAFGKKNAADWRLFAIYYHDWRAVTKTDNRPLALRGPASGNLRIGTYGGHYLHTTETPAGKIDFTLWGALQSGAWGVQPHRAYSLDIEAGIQPKVLPRLKPWLRAGYTEGSGDGNGTDGRHGSFFQILPTPRPFARTPFYDMINSRDVFGMVTLRPHKAWAIKSEVHAVALASGSDLWYQGGGAFQPWSFGYVGRNTGGRRGLGRLYDVSADWNVSPKFSVSAYAGLLRGGDVQKFIYPQNADGAFGYVELHWKF